MPPAGAPKMILVIAAAAGGGGGLPVLSPRRG